MQFGKAHSVRVNSVILIISILTSVTLIVLSLTSRQNLSWSYPAGVMLMITLIFAMETIFYYRSYRGNEFRQSAKDFA